MLNCRTVDYGSSAADRQMSHVGLMGKFWWPIFPPTAAFLGKPHRH